MFPLLIYYLEKSAIYIFVFFGRVIPNKLFILRLDEITNIEIVNFSNLMRLYLRGDFYAVLGCLNATKYVIIKRCELYKIQKEHIVI
ncbi:hypothetical protein Btaycd_007080 [Bartonella taylorii]|nr:hypothetical protein Btaycd_007080 [Bartonella taylorii]